MQVFVRFFGLFIAVILLSSCATIYHEALDAEKRGDLLSAYTSISEAYKQDPTNKDLKKVYDEIKMKLAQHYADLAGDVQNLNLFKKRETIQKALELEPNQVDFKKIKIQIDDGIERINILAKDADQDTDAFERVNKFINIKSYEPFFDEVKQVKVHIINENQKLVDYFKNGAVAGTESKNVCLINYIQSFLPEIKGLGDVKIRLLSSLANQANGLSKKYQEVPDNRRKGLALFYSLISSRYSGQEVLPFDLKTTFGIPLLAVTFSDDFSEQQKSAILGEIQSYADKNLIKAISEMKGDEETPKNALRVYLKLADLSSEPSSNSGLLYSKFRSGEQYISNPDYERAVLQYNEAQSNLKNAQYQNTVNPGFGSSLSLGIAQGALYAAQSRLNQTPSQISIPVYTDYQYQKVEISFKLSFKVGFKLIDDQNHVLDDGHFVFEQTHNTEGISGAHPDDINGISNETPDDPNDVISNFSKGVFKGLAVKIIDDEVFYKDYFEAKVAQKNNDIGGTIEGLLSWEILNTIKKDSDNDEDNYKGLVESLSLPSLQFNVSDIQECEKYDIGLANIVKELRDVAKEKVDSPEIKEAIDKFDPLNFYKVEQLNKDNFTNIFQGIFKMMNPKKKDEGVPPSSIEGYLDAIVTIKTPNGSGSGFLISSDGYVVTNYHVIAESSDINVLFKNGNSFHADIISIVKYKDLALLKTNVSGVKYLLLGDINKMHIGDIVYALGNPAGGGDLILTNTVTKGVLSSVRMMEAPFNSNEQIQFVQTDASINPGNSGGALINEKGEVVGVTSQKYSKVGISGLNFAISVEEVKKSFQDNIK